MAEIDVKRKSLLAFCLLGCAGPGVAQSSVTLYGTISTGLVYSGDVGGSSYVGILDNDHWNTTLGMKGNEDLGGGTSAIFNLQVSFRPSSGALSGAGGCTQVFCKAYLGISNKQLGVLTLGRQQDFMVDLLPYEANYYSTTLAAIPGGLNRFNSPGINNGIKYRQSFGPVSLGFMYALSDSSATGQPMSGRSLSALLSYHKGGFDAGLAWSSFSHYAFKPWSATTGIGFPTGVFWNVRGVSGTNASVPLDRLDMAGAGASYDFGATRVAVGAFDIHMRAKSGHSGSMPVLDFNVSRRLRPDLMLAGGYWHANFPAGGFRADNVNVSLDYLLSKRTDVFIAPVYERVSGSGHAQMFMLGAASGGNQLAVDVGIRHNF
ncbi:porin [Burkholderia multivorans]|uniref:porin n=1 Tax=Burkholderia multivorans TaxID=87883 RepID=UPI001C21A7EC|nr:porin [Burkholderia multivorans]MBU9133412.1 porin [Burkholderia multivorans]